MRPSVELVLARLNELAMPPDRLCDQQVRRYAHPATHASPNFELATPARTTRIRRNTAGPPSPACLGLGAPFRE